MDGTTALAVLGLDPGASASQIKAAFRARAKQLHPDHNGAADAFLGLQGAYRRALAHARAAERHRPTATGTPVRLSVAGGGVLAPSAAAPGTAHRADRIAHGTGRRARWMPIGDPPAHRVDVVDTSRPTPMRTGGPGPAGRSFEDHLALALAG